MSFVQRAEKLRARGEDARALLVLVEGLKRHPDNEQAVDTLLAWYAVEIPTPNIESDVVAALVLQPDANDLWSTLVDNLKASGRTDISGALYDAGKLAGLRYVPPAPAAPPADATVEATVAAAVGDEDFAHQEAAGDAPAPAPASAEKAAKSKPAKAQETSGTRPRRKWGRWVVAAVVLAGLGYASTFWIGEIERVSATRSIDATLMQFDPVTTSQIRASVEDANRRWPQSREFQERLFFLDAVEHRPNVLEAPYASAWGLAGSVVRALEAGKLEDAIAQATRLEHSYPDEPVGVWTQAMVLERRGKLSGAAQAYARLEALHPTFLAGILGNIRVQTRMGNRAEMLRLVQALERLDARHPYLVVKRVSFPGMDDFVGPVPDGQPALTPDGDQFSKAMAHLHNAVQALRTGRITDAASSAELASVDRHLASAQLVVAVTRTASYEVQGAQEALDAIAEIEGLSDEQLLLIQSVAPRALAFAGRPDVARRYVAMFGADVEGVDAEQRGIFKTRWNEWQPRLEGALTTRLMVMNELGLTEQAARIAQQYVGHAGTDELKLLVAALSEQGGANVQMPAFEGDAAAAAEVIKAAQSGKSRWITESAPSIPQDKAWSSLVARYLAQAHLALREVGHALALVSGGKRPVLDRISLDGVALRVVARFGRGNEQYTATLERVMRAEPTGVNRLVDVAYGMFWQTQLKDAEALVKRALELNPRHRQANWLYGLVTRQRGNFKDAETYFQRSGRDFDNSKDVLIELGMTLSDLNNHDEARKMFYKALLLERSSLDAIEGLGAAYTRLDAATAARDLERIVEGYPGGREYDPQRAEALKWLAVVKGSRRGNESALDYLNRAEALVGRRADLLVERARFSEANDDHTGARALYAQALQRNSALGDAHLGLARTAIRENDTKVARDHLEKYLELEPRGDARQWAEKKLSSL